MSFPPARPVPPPPTLTPSSSAQQQLMTDYRMEAPAKVLELVDRVLGLKGHADARAHEHFKYARDTLDDSLLQLVCCLQPRHSKFAYQLLAKAADPGKAAHGWRCAPHRALGWRAGGRSAPECFVRGRQLAALLCGGPAGANKPSGLDCAQAFAIATGYVSGQRQAHRPTPCEGRPGRFGDAKGLLASPHTAHRSPARPCPWLRAVSRHTGGSSTSWPARSRPSMLSKPTR